MHLFYMILGIAGLGVGVVAALCRSVQKRLRLAAGILAVLAAGMLAYLRIWSPDSLNRRYEAANLRQGYALGFGLGQYLKQSQPGRRVVILRGRPDQPRDPETIKGLRAGLEGALTIVGERTLEIPMTEQYTKDLAARFTLELLAELKTTGADIVVSFPGLPTRIGEFTAIDVKATQALWRSPEYRALQWVLPRPPQPWSPGCFREGNVLAVVQEKPQAVQPGEKFPAYLEIKGTPAELFNAWFELVTAEEGA